MMARVKNKNDIFYLNVLILACLISPGLTNTSTTDRTTSVTAAPAGVWGDWGAWNDCSVTCGGGTKVRSRTCTTSTPCEGDMTQMEDCNTEACPPVEGVWTDWSRWSQCSLRCGRGGTKTRTRTCSSPDGGSNAVCAGSASDSKRCRGRNCRVPANGSMRNWLPWSGCSASCGVGLTIRIRICWFPSNAVNGIYCVGITRQTQVCFGGIC